MSKDNLDVQYALAEFGALRSEIELRSQLDHATQRNVVLASGAVLSWVFSRVEVTPLLGIVLLLIPMMLYIGLVQQARHKAYGKRIGDYLKTLESHAYRNSDVEGWEHFLSRVRYEEEKKGVAPLYNTYREFLEYAIRGSTSNSAKKGHSLSATIVDNRYLGVGVILFFLIAVAYLTVSLMPYVLALGEMIFS